MICYPVLPDTYYYRTNGDIATGTYGIEDELVMWCWPRKGKWEFTIDLAVPHKHYDGEAASVQDCYDTAAAIMWLGAFNEY